MLRLSQLEKDLLDWISEKYNNHALAQQISRAQPVSRELDTAGYSLRFSVPADVPSLSPGDAPGYMNFGPAIKSPQFEGEGGAVLHFNQQYRMDVLKVFVGTSSFPEEVVEYKLLTDDEADIEWP